MQYTKTTVITPPEYSIAPNGKLLPVAHIAVCEVFIDPATGQQHGKSKPPRAVLQMRRDGSWGFEPHPVHPETGQPFVFTDAQVAAWNATLDVYEERYGVVDHVAPASDGLPAISVSYAQRVDGVFDRVVTEVPEPQN